MVHGLEVMPIGMKNEMEQSVIFINLLNKKPAVGGFGSRLRH